MADPHIGRLRFRVEILTRDDAPGGDWSVSEVLTPVDTVSADIVAVGAITFYGSAQVDRPITHRITMRYREDLTTDRHIIRHGPVIYRVRRVLHLDGRTRWTVVEAEQERRQ